MGLFHQLMRPKANSTANDFMADVLGSKTDTAATGAVTTTDSIAAYVKQLVTANVAMASQAMALPQCCVKTDGAILTGVDPIFTIAGGPVLCEIFGLVTTLVVGNSNLRLQHITTAPAATVELNAGAVAVNDDAVGTMYYNVGATSIFTPSSGLGFALLDPVTVQPVQFLLAPGVVQCLGSAARAGVIAWYMHYRPLSTATVVTAAA
jgi:hypothetical protein